MSDGQSIGARAAGFVRSQPVLTVSAVIAVVSMALVPPSSEYMGYIDVRTLCILFCFMAVVAGLRECNLFGNIAGRLLAGERSLRSLCAILVALPFFSSMLITNDVALITFVPFTILVLGLADHRERILPVVVLQTLAANLGSMLLPFGNPQNLYIHSRYGLDTMDVVALLAPLVIIGGVVLFLMCSRFGSEGVHVAMSSDREIRSPRFLTLMAAMFALCVLSVLRVVPYQAVILITVVVLLLTHRRVLLRVDYGLLLTFVFLFVFTGNVAQVDAVHEILAGLMDWDPMLTSLGMSQVISNVPAATLLSGFTDQWQGLLAGVDIGGFGTPIASMASMISLGFYSRTEGARTGRYLALFTVTNVVMIAVLVPVYYLAS